MADIQPNKIEVNNTTNEETPGRLRFFEWNAADFDQFLRINIYAADYIILDRILGTTPHRLTKLKNDPAIITEAEIETLAPLLRITPAQLSKKVKEYSNSKN